MFDILQKVLQGAIFWLTVLFIFFRLKPRVR